LDLPALSSTVFPLNAIDANSDILEAINNPINLTIDLEHLNSMIFDPFNINDENSEGPLSDIDPDHNLLREIRGTAIQNCRYYYSSDLMESLKDNSNKTEMSIFHLNIRSIPKNLNTLIPTLHSSGLNFDILGFSETWLKASNADAYGIPGYSHEFITRPEKPGGGISLYINEKWSYKNRPDLSIISDDLEMLWIEVEKESINSTSNLLIGLIYRRPGSNPCEFNIKLQDTLTLIANEHKEIVHIGDYNLNLLHYDTHQPTSDFIDLNFTQTLFPLINKPTRITDKSATLIDNIFSTIPFTADSKTGILLWDISDHFPVFFIKYQTSPIPLETSRISRSHCAANKQSFSTEIMNIDWSPILTNTDAQSAYTIFHKTISQSYNEAFPLKKTKIGYTNRLPWLTPGLQTSIKRNINCTLPTSKILL
jgi:hypothetical protein